MENDATGHDSSGLGSENGNPQVVRPATPEEQEKADQLIRQANLAKIRGDRDLSEKLLNEAATVAPGSGAVLEALADIYVEQKQVRKARDLYQQAFQLDPLRVSAERKYGECVLSIQLALDPNFARPPDDDSLASGKVVLILSFLLPGLGQLANFETKKGVSMLATYLFGVVFALLVPNGLSGLPTLIGRHGQPLNPLVFLPLAICGAAWVWSVADAGARAKTYERKPIVKPVPPVDKDY